MDNLFKGISHKGVCDVCGKETDVVAASSMIGNYAYCKECLKLELEPYDGIVDYISCVTDEFPNYVNEYYKELVEHNLKHYGKTIEEFNDDIRKSIQEEEEYFEQLQAEDMSPNKNKTEEDW